MPTERSDGLGCAVLSLGNEPTLAAAVRSLAEQTPRPEIVVVNSGGGDPAGPLRAAGLEVPVVDHPSRLLPGGARNAGIDALSSRYVAFLAADCLAEPGWAAGRLRAHHAGAAAVASVMTNAHPDSRPACAAYMLLHHRRMPDTPPRSRLLYGLSYDRELFERFGRFRDDLRAGEDTDFNARFAASVSVVLARDVRTAHLNPVTVGELVRDQFARGRRQALTREELFGGRRPLRWLIVHQLRNVPIAAWRAARTRDRRERARLLRALPLAPLAALAYASGGAAATLGPRSRVASRRERLLDDRPA